VNYTNLNTPLVSIIIPNYNHEKYLKQRLDSIFNQTYQRFEVILLDDFSTDNSRNILSSYAKHKNVSHCIFNEQNSGNTSLQWNKGMLLAKGDYIWIAESDDYCELYFLEKLLKPFIKNKDIVLTYCQSNKVDEYGIIRGNWINHTNDLNKKLFSNDFIMEGNAFIENFLIYKNVIPNASAVLFKAESAKTLGLLDTDFSLKYNADWVFYTRLIAQRKIGYVSESFNSFRYHSSSVIAKAIKKENLASLNEIEILTREKIIDFLIDKKIPNIKKIVCLNRKLIKDLKYDIGMYLIRKGKIFRGILILFSSPNRIKKKRNVFF